jgi:hypothetical protein
MSIAVSIASSSLSTFARAADTEQRSRRVDRRDCLEGACFRAWIGVTRYRPLEDGFDVYLITVL